MALRALMMCWPCGALIVNGMLLFAAEPAATDRYGDPLPPAAITRLGTVRFRTPGGGIHASFTANGRRVVVASPRRLLWFNAESGRVWRRVEFEKHSLYKACVTPDRETLATFQLHNDLALGKRVIDVTLWNVETAKRRSQFRIIPQQRLFDIRDVTFTSDGSAFVLADSYAQAKLQVWNLNGTRHEDYGVKLRSVSAVATTGDLIAIGGREGLEIWNRKTRQRVGGFQNNNSRINAMTYTPDGKYLIVAAQQAGHGLTLRDPESGRFLRRIGPANYRNYVYQISVSPNLRECAIAGYDRRLIEVWDLTTGKRTRQIDRLTDGAKSLAFSPDGSRLASVGFDAIVDVWNLRTNRHVGAERIGHRKPPRLLAFLGDSKTLVTTGDDGTIRTWNARTGKQQQVMRHGDVSRGRRQSVTPWVRGMAVSPDGKWIASSSLDDTVRLWNARTGKERFRLFGHGRLGGMHSVAFTKDGTRFATWADGAFLRVWDVRTGKLKIEHELKAGLTADDPIDRGGPRFDFAEGRLSPDGRYLLQSRGTTLSLLDVTTAKTLTGFPQGTRFSQQQPISADGTLWLQTAPGPTQKRPGGLPIPANYHIATIRRLPDGKPLTAMQFPGRIPGPAAFSHDGRLIACTGRGVKDLVRICEVKTGSIAKLIRGLDARPTAFAFSPDGRLLAASLADTSIVVFDLTLIPGIESPKGVDAK